MESAGCDLWYPLDKLALRGIVEVLPRVPELFRIRRDVARRLREAGAPLFIGIDAPDFNLGLEAGRSVRVCAPSITSVPRSGPGGGSASIPSREPRIVCWRYFRSSLRSTRSMLGSRS